MKRYLSSLLAAISRAAKQPSPELKYEQVPMPHIGPRVRRARAVRKPFDARPTPCDPMSSTPFLTYPQHDCLVRQYGARKTRELERSGAALALVQPRA